MDAAKYFLVKEIKKPHYVARTYKATIDGDRVIKYGNFHFYPKQFTVAFDPGTVIQIMVEN